jgi:transcriptional regulator with XRE-family HTH domain
MVDFYRVLGQRIRQARKDSRYTQAELGRLLGYSANAILGWEKGTRRVNIEDLVRLAAVLKRPLSYFVEGYEEQAHTAQARETLDTFLHDLLREAVAELREEVTRTFHEVLHSEEFREAVVAAVREGMGQLPQFLPARRQPKAKR